MDPITHGMFGALLSGLGLRRKHAFGVVLLSSVLPDIDLIARLWGPEALLRYHRGITHSVFAIMAVPLIVGYIAGRRAKKGAAYYAAISFAGYAMHVYLDLTTQYGVRILFPLDSTFYSLDHFFILDQYLIAALVLFCVLAYKQRKWMQDLAVGVMIFIALYYGARVYIHHEAQGYLRRTLETHTIKAVIPLPGGVLRWWFVAGSPDGGYKTGVVDLFLDRVYIHKTYPPEQASPEIEASRANGAVDAFIAFSKHPYASVIRHGDKVIVRWEDMGFAFAGPDRFVAQVTIGSDGKPVNGRFSF